MRDGRSALTCLLPLLTRLRAYRCQDFCHCFSSRLVRTRLPIYATCRTTHLDRLPWTTFFILLYLFGSGVLFLCGVCPHRSPCLGPLHTFHILRLCSTHHISLHLHACVRAAPLAGSINLSMNLRWFLHTPPPSTRAWHTARLLLARIHSLHCLGTCTLQTRPTPTPSVACCHLHMPVAHHLPRDAPLRAWRLHARADPG